MSNNKTVVITGANGFIGRQALRPLRDAGYRVVAPHIGEPLDEPEGVEWVLCDLLKEDDVSRLFASVRPTHLLHLAWGLGEDFYYSCESFRWVEVGLRVFDCVTQTFLRLLHPVMPFVTEELYHQLNFSPADGSIMESPWPTSMTDAELERLGATQNLVDLVAAKFELIRAVRNVRAGYLIPAVKKTDVIIDVTSGDTCEFMQQDLVSLKALLYASDVKVVTAFQAEGPTAVAVSTIGTAYVPLAGIIDVTAEKTRLQKQEDELLGFLAKSQRKLGNEQFVSRAPAEVVSRERERLTELRDKLERLREQLAALA